MLGLGKLKNTMRGAIGRHRLSMPVKALHEVTSFFESAYSNEGSDFHLNGEQSLLRKLASKDFRVAIDVGANFGDWLMEALAVWPKCHAHAFEVAPQTFQKLSDIIRRSEQSDRVSLNGVGVGDKRGVQKMYYFAEHPELTCDLPRHSHAEAVAFDANITTLDEYCRANSIESVDFLKIDVEGAEYKVLQGFSEHLSAGKVDCIQFEYGAFSVQTRFLLKDYYSMLSEKFWIGKVFPTFVEFRDYDWTMEDFKFSNYCCVSRRRPELKSLLAS